MRRMILPIALALLSAAPMAHADSDKDLVGPGYMTRQQIATALTNGGYSVQKVESDDGAYKVKALRGAQKLKLTVDPKTGSVIATKPDD